MYALTVLSVVYLSSCAEDFYEPAAIIDEDAQTIPRAVYPIRTVKFSRPNGNYTAAMAAADFGNVSGWNTGTTKIATNTMRVFLAANTATTSAGQTADINVTDMAQYQLSWKVKFHPNFAWGASGKTGFGLKIGEGNTGCDKADDGNGGSARITWSTVSNAMNPNGDAILRPYIYHHDMTANCGVAFGSRYPASGDLDKGVWHTIKMQVKSNTGSNKDGFLKIVINGTTLVERDMRWTTNDAQRLINRMSTGTYRGDAVSTDGLIYYDNVTWTNVLD